MKKSLTNESSHAEEKGPVRRQYYFKAKEKRTLVITPDYNSRFLTLTAKARTRTIPN